MQSENRQAVGADIGQGELIRQDRIADQQLAFLFLGPGAYVKLGDAGEQPARAGEPGLVSLQQVFETIFGPVVNRDFP